MNIKTYNEKGFLLPDSIRSMACFHAKLFESGEYLFRIHDCITGIRLRGELNTEQDFDEAIEKMQTLKNACQDFELHLRELKMLNFQTEIVKKEVEIWT